MKVPYCLAWTVLFLAACRPEPELPTYLEPLLADERKVAGMFTNEFPRESVRELDSGWVFHGQDSLAGINRKWPADFSQSVRISLPHRMSFANHSLWYSWKGTLGAGVLFIDADDGVQCWLNGKRILRAEDGEFFEVDVSGTANLHLRVINNAMAGGLRRVQFLSQQAFEFWNVRKKQISQGILVDRKLELLQDPDLKSEWEGMSYPELNAFLKDYPILYTPPVLIWGTDGRPFLRWVSESAGTAILRSEAGEEIRIESTDGVFTHDLDARSRVSFRLYQGKSYQGFFSVTTNRVSDSVKMALWGDSQGGWETFSEVVDAISAHQPDLSIGVGDLVNNGSEGWVYPRLLQLLSRMQTTHLLVPGNHDYDGYYDDLYAKHMNHYLLQPDMKTHGMQQFGSAAILSLDPNRNFPVSVPEDTPQRQWLREQLESDTWQKAPWKIILLHQPPYSQGWPGYQGEWRIRKLLEPYFHRGLIDLVVAGHTHDYERLSLNFSGYPVHFLVVGGAGGGLEPEGMQSEVPQMDRLIKKHHYGILDIDSSRMRFKAYDLEGNTLDELTVNK